ncbi:Uncharacterized protein APZ42_021207 [Daphnia magna]|uniref:Uncharacterized protein n=1 Tax=Daphnia magna TaxID=35525 RepID=A0A164WVG0_9CRUS|nr:Uncharacterized protein APZ42_021207 [Daphnia magna]
MHGTIIYREQKCGRAQIEKRTRLGRFLNGSAGAREKRSRVARTFW